MYKNSGGIWQLQLNCLFCCSVMVVKFVLLLTDLHIEVSSSPTLRTGSSFRTLFRISIFIRDMCVCSTYTWTFQQILVKG